MADIFISYSREDRPRVEPLTAALVSAGYSVWWDKDLAGGSRYLDKTEAELNAAKAVLVVWTKTSIASHWVADEAGAGRDSGRLVPISIEGTMPPLGFRQFQVIDFSRWKPGDEAKLGELRTALANVIGSSAAPAVAAASEPRKAISKRVLMLGGLAAAGIAAVAAVAVLASGLLGGAERIEVGTQLFAFYGFTAPEGDAVATEIAERATDQTFQGLGAMHVETAARTETVGKSADQYLDQAEKLGARFALSGSVRSEAGSQRVNVSMRLQDVPSRKMLWEQTLSADASAPAAVADRILHRRLEGDQ